MLPAFMFDVLCQWLSESVSQTKFYLLCLRNMKYNDDNPCLFWCYKNQLLKRQGCQHFKVFRILSVLIYLFVCIYVYCQHIKTILTILKILGRFSIKVHHLVVNFERNYKTHCFKTFLSITEVFISNFHSWSNFTFDLWHFITFSIVMQLFYCFNLMSTEQKNIRLWK